MNHSTTRRSFLASSAAVALATAMHVRGDVPSEGRTLRWGVIGTGNRGCFTHVAVLKEAPDSRIVALCDVAADRLATAVEKAGQPVEKFDDYHKLLAREDVDAVVIAVPNLLHREILEATIKAGKHVLCEKPAGASPADADAIKQMVDSAKTLVMFGMQYRHMPKFAEIFEIVKAGKIGKPKYLVQTCSRGDWNLSPRIWQYADPKLFGGQPRNWRFSHAATGGTLNELCCHFFDVLHGLVGALPRRLSCDGGIAVCKDGRDTWDHATVTMQYPDGCSAAHTLTMFGPNRFDLSVAGDEGTVETTADGLSLSVRGKNGKSAKTQTIAPKVPEKHTADGPTMKLYLDFLECLKTGKKPDAGVDRAVAASRTCWLAELASERKAEVAWSEIEKSG